MPNVAFFFLDFPIWVVRYFCFLPFLRRLSPLHSFPQTNFFYLMQVPVFYLYHSDMFILLITFMIACYVFHYFMFSCFCHLVGLETRDFGYRMHLLNHLLCHLYNNSFNMTLRGQWASKKRNPNI